MNLARLRNRLSANTWSMIAIGAAVLIANAIYLLDLSDPNPLGQVSELGTYVGRGFIFGLQTIDPSNGYISQALGHRAALDLVHLHIPWWNPFEGTGAPLVGESQSGALFPPTLLLLISNGQVYERILLEFIAGAATYFLLCRLTVNRWVAVAAGIAFALNGTFSWIWHAAFNPIALLPLLVLGIERMHAASVAGRRGGWVLFAVAGALSAYAGFPETAYIDTLLAVLWVGWRCTGLERPVLIAMVRKLAAGVGVGVLLCAPLLVAFAGFLNHAYLGGNQTGFLGGLHFPTFAIPQLLMPYVYGPIEAFNNPSGTLGGLWGSVGGYISTTILLFAILGLLARGRKGLRMILLIWILLAFARMYGQIPLLGHVLGWLPQMSNVAFFRLGAPALEFAMIVLAALGIDDLVRVPEHRRRLVWAAGGVLLIVIWAGLEARGIHDSLGSAPNVSKTFIASLVWGAALPLAAGVVGLVRRLDIRVVAGLLALDALAMFIVPELSAPRVIAIDTSPVSYLRQHLGLSRFATLGPLQPNYGSYYGLAELNVNDNPLPSIFAHYVTTKLDHYARPTLFVGNYGGNRSTLVPSPQQELLRNFANYRAASVAYVLAPPGQTLPASPARYTLVARTHSAWIYHVTGSAPYFGAAGCTVRPDNQNAVTVTCSQPSTLVRRETDLPGWSATTGGRNLSITRQSGLFQAVTVPAGTHRVVFSYSPPGILWGILGFVAGVAAIGFTAVRRRSDRPAV